MRPRRAKPQKQKIKKIPIFNARTGTLEQLEEIRKTDGEWTSLLTREQFRITRKNGTEMPYTDESALPPERGFYQCICCGIDLFSSDEKYDSGTGWPSFWDAVSSHNIVTRLDYSQYIPQTKVLCARCGAYLGHIFDDGPPPTRQRYCVNSVALKFIKAE